MCGRRRWHASADGPCRFGRFGRCSRGSHGCGQRVWTRSRAAKGSLERGRNSRHGLFLDGGYATRTWRVCIGAVGRGSQACMLLLLLLLQNLQLQTTQSLDLEFIGRDVALWRVGGGLCWSFVGLRVGGGLVVAMTAVSVAHVHIGGFIVAVVWGLLGPGRSLRSLGWVGLRVAGGQSLQWRARSGWRSSRRCGSLGIRRGCRGL